MKICLSVSCMDVHFQHMVDELQKEAQVDVVGLDGFSLEGYDLFIGKKLSKEILATADRLKAVFAYKTGVDNFPMAELKQKDILLINSHIDAKIIAEYAFGLSLSLVNRITECDKKLRKGIWYDKENPYWESFFDMKVGLLGYGHIGKNIHQILLRNQVKTYTIDRGHRYENIQLVHTVEELCDTCDLIILSLPKTPETDLLFNADLLRHMEGKYLVNVGRSNCIDEKALYESLKSGWLAGAAIDTWATKPKTLEEQLYPSKFPLAELENIVLSPHQAMKVESGHSRYVEDTLAKVRAYLHHEPLTDQVDLVKGY